MLPCGNAVYLPKLTRDDAALARRSRGRRPGCCCEDRPASCPRAAWRGRPCTRRCVMSLARCMSAISAGDLIIRQPAVTGSALTKSIAGAAFRTPSKMKKRSRSSTPTRPGRDAAVLQDLRDQPIGALVFLPDAHDRGRRASISSRARASSKPGRPTPVAFRRNDRTNGRSLSPQRTPVK